MTTTTSHDAHNRVIFHLAGNKRAVQVALEAHFAQGAMIVPGSASVCKENSSPGDRAEVSVYYPHDAQERARKRRKGA